MGDGITSVPTTLFVGQDGTTTIDKLLAQGQGWRKLEWFKLFLLHEEDWPPHARTSGLIRNAVDTMHMTGMGAVSVMAAFLTHLWDMALAHAKRDFQRLDAAHVKVDLVITIPAHWPSDAANRMDQAVAKSSIACGGQEVAVRVHMIEPEAAAIGNLTDLAMNRNISNLPDVSLSSLSTYELTLLQSVSCPGMLNVWGP